MRDREPAIDSSTDRRTRGTARGPAVRRLSLPSWLTSPLVRALSARRPGVTAGLLLAAALVVYAGVTLWLTRGTAFSADEVDFFAQARRGLDPAAIVRPHNSQLMALNRVLYAGVLGLFGPDYLVIRLAMIAAVAAAAVCLFLLLRSRLGEWIALAATTVVLFLGSTAVTVTPVTMPFAQAAAAGMAAFLALERRSSRGDVLACVLLVLSLLSWSTGIAFVAAAAAWILLEPGRRGRFFVFLIPAVLYGVWYLWSQRFGQGVLSASNLLLIPNYAADSFAAAAGSLAGLNADFSGAPAGVTVEIGWGRVVAAVLSAAVIVRLRRAGASAALVAFLALLAVLWITGALGSGPLRPPEASRYVYTVAIGVILVTAEAFRGVRVTPAVLLGVLAVMLIALPGNLVHLRETGAALRLTSAETRARLGVLELERPWVKPRFAGGLVLPVRANEYFAAVDRFGSFALSPEQIVRQAAPVRVDADATLGQIVRPRAIPVAGPPGRCLTVPREGAAAGFQLPPGGAVLRSDTGARLRLRRFASKYVIAAGPLAAGRFAVVLLPADAARRPWSASVDATVAVCPLRPSSQTRGARGPGR